MKKISFLKIKNGKRINVDHVVRKMMKNQKSKFCKYNDKIFLTREKDISFAYSEVTNYAKLREDKIKLNSIFHVIFNGSIFNKDELLNEINIKDKFVSDNQLIIEGYKKFGKKFFSKINGPFVCIFFDYTQDEQHTLPVE